MTNQTNTYQGTNVEHLFANSIVDHPNALDIILEAGSIPGDSEIDKDKVKVIGGNRRKTDVELPLVSGDQSLRVNVKSFSGTGGYNHVERRNLRDFCRRNQIRRSDQDFLIRLWLRKARDTSGKLVLENEIDRVQEIFRLIEPAVSAFVGNDHPQILAIYSGRLSKWHLYDMTHQVLPKVRSTRIGITSRGGNITIGDYIVIQRKGSRRGENGADPYSIEHGSNDVQIKLKTGRFFEEISPIASYVL